MCIAYYITYIDGRGENQTFTTTTTTTVCACMHLERPEAYRLKREKTIVNVIELNMRYVRFPAVVYIITVMGIQCRVDTRTAAFIRTYIIFTSHSLSKSRGISTEGGYILCAALIELYVDKK